MKNLIIVLTHACNFNCTYCYNNHNDSTINIIDAKKSVDDFVFKFQDDNKLDITFFGGEPTLCLDLIVDIKNYCQSAYPDIDWHYNMTTNLSFINQRLLNEIYLDNNFAIMISIDGPEEMNSNRITRDGNPTFKTVYDNILYLKKELPQERLDKISLHFTLSKDNRHHIMKLIEFAEDLNLQYVVGFVSFENWNDISYEEFKNIFSKVIFYCSEKETTRPLRSIVLFRRIAKSFKNIYRDEPINFNTKSCGQAINQFSVDPTGNYYPCHHYSNSFLRNKETLIIGNVKTGFNNDFMKEINNLESKKINRCIERQCPLSH